MKKTLLFVLLASFIFIQSSFAQKSGDQLFNNSYIHKIEVNFYDDDYWSKLESNYNEIADSVTAKKKYLPAEIIIDGNKLDTVGVRHKGFSSNWGIEDSKSPMKKPFKIDINEFVKGQKYDGLKKFSLNNGYEDPTLMRDFLALKLMRDAGVPAPRVSYANLYLNGKHWGVYLIVEQVDKTFLKKHFSSNKGNLYKCVNNSRLEWFGTNYESYEEEFELKTNEEEKNWTDFIRFVKIINKVDYQSDDYLDSLHTIFNVDNFLKAMSVDVAIGNWDSYFDNGRNFYVYHNPDDGKFHWIPWDYNLSFTDEFMGTVIQNTTVGGFKPLTENMFEVESLRNMAYETYCKLLSYNFTYERVKPIIDNTLELIKESHMNSEMEFYTTEELIQNLTETVDIDDLKLAGLKNVFSIQTENILKDLQAANYECSSDSYINPGDVVINEIMAINDTEIGIADQNGEYDDWIELYNNTANSINLKDYYLSDDKANPAKWQLPDTTIAANGFLIIWADKDIEQKGLHTNFKLSKGGEFLSFSNPNSQIIDSLTFGEQELPKTYARIPNGTGSFANTDATFGQTNGTTSSVGETNNSKIKLFPNPASSFVNIELSNSHNISSIQLITMTGQTLLNKDVSSNQMHVDIDVSSITSGVYFVVFRNGTSEVETKKLVVTNR